MTACELPLTDDGRSSGTCFLTFATDEGAQAGLALDQATFGERWLSVKLSTEKPKQKFSGPSEKMAGCMTIFMGNLSWDVDEQAVRDFFSECGTVKEVRFAEDRETGRFKGFGHVEFEETEGTDKAVALAGSDLCGRPIRVDFAAVKERRPFGDRDNSPRGGGGRGGGRFGGGGRGGGGGGGGRGFGGRDNNRSASPKPINKNKGSIVAGQGKKITF